MTASLWTRRILMSFVLITVGFSLGRQTAPRPPPAADVGAGPDRLVVYAAHMTFRCAECTQIEALARELLETEFAEDLKYGRIQLVTVDYLKDTDFAARYDIASSTLVVSRIRGGRETRHDRLDQVWTHVHDRDAFMTYVRQAIQNALEAEDGE